MFFQLYCKELPELESELRWLGVITIVDIQTMDEEVFMVEYKSSEEELVEWFNLFLAPPTIPQ